MEDDLGPNSHLGLRVGVKDILIQLAEKNLPKAFINSCSHRGSLLCEEGRQDGRIRCPYHGWVYDKEGIPVGIPSKECFPEVIANPKEFRLQVVQCAKVGKFIFVSLAKNPISLADFLGDQYGFLESISLGLKDVIQDFKKSLHSNWKVVIENSLEGYHVPMVHKKTFLVADGMSKSSEDVTTNLENKYHSSMNNHASPEWIQSFENKLSKKIGLWPYKNNHYTHHHIFPNTTITSFLGYSFHIQIFKPISHNVTEVYSRTYNTSFKNQSVVGEKLIAKIYEDSKQFTMKVFEEDTLICEKVFRGLSNAKKNLILGQGIEDRVQHFQKAYQTIMTNDVI